MVGQPSVSHYCGCGERREQDSGPGDRRQDVRTYDWVVSDVSSTIVTRIQFRSSPGQTHTWLLVTSLGYQIISTYDKHYIKHYIANISNIRILINITLRNNVTCVSISRIHVTIYRRSEHYKVIRNFSCSVSDVIFRIDQMLGRGPPTLPVIAGPKISGERQVRHQLTRNAIREERGKY